MLDLVALGKMDLRIEFVDPPLDYLVVLFLFD